MDDKHGTDDKFGGSHMFAGKDGGEFAGAMQMICGNGFPIELVQLIQSGNEVVLFHSCSRCGRVCSRSAAIREFDR